MKTVNFNPGLFNRNEISLIVPDKSYDLIYNLRDIYYNIIKYFEEANNQDKKKKAYDNLCNPGYGFIIDGTRLNIDDIEPSYKNPTEAINILKKANKYERIQSALESSKNSSTDESKIIRYLLPMIFLYSIIDFGTVENKWEFTCDIENSNSIYTQLNDNGNLYFRFTKENRFFSLLDQITNGSWRDWDAIFDPDGIGKDEQKRKINFYDILTKGYATHKEKTYYCFNTETIIKRFIKDCIMGASSEAPNKTVYFDFNKIKYLSDFKIEIGYNVLYKTWAEQIKSNIISLIAEPNMELNTYSDEEFGDGSLSNILLSFAGNEEEKKAVIDYYNIYKYFESLLKKYLDYKINEAGNSKDFEKDENIKLLLKKITGSTSATNFSPDSSAYQSGKPGIVQIVDYFRKELNVDVNTSGIDQFATLKNIKFKNFNSYDPKWQKIEILKSSNAEEIVNKQDEFKMLLQFSELKTIDTTATISNENLENEIKKITSFGGNIISKISFLCFYSIKDENAKVTYSSDDQNYEYRINIYNVSLSSIDEYNTQPKINNVSYTSYEDLYNELGRLVFNYLKSIISNREKERANEQLREETLKSVSSFSSYIRDRLAQGYFTEKDFFYLNTDKSEVKKAPINSFVDVEFRIPVDSDDKKETVAKWIPVTSVRNYSNNNNEIKFEYEGDELYAGSYFDSMELTDEAGIKKITLTLKSINDMNLENIIYRSVELDKKEESAKLKANEGEKINAFDLCKQIIQDGGDGNFRVRFGYRDEADKIDGGEDSTIKSLNVDSDDFKERTKVKILKDGETRIVKPVQTYPWTNFKITGISSSIKDGNDTYTITGVSTGSYIFDNLSLNGVHTIFTGISGNNVSVGDYLGSPKNVAGRITNWITKASCEKVQNSNGESDYDLTTARIVFLGDESGTIIDGYDASKRTLTSNLNYVLKNGTVFEGGNLQSMENSFFDKDKIITTKNFSLLNNYSSMSLKEVLDKLVDWLPTRIYYIAKDKSNRTIALQISYENVYAIGDFFSSCPFKTENMVYQIIEADACIYKPETITHQTTLTTNSRNADMVRGGGKTQNNATAAISGNVTVKQTVSQKKETLTDEDFHKVYFIRMYYKGPGIVKGKENNDYLRVYNYRSTQNQVIQGIELETKGSEFGNLMSSVTVLSATGKPVVFTYNKDTAKMDTAFYMTTGDDVEEKKRKNVDLGEGASSLKPYFTLNNSNYVQYDNYVDNETDDPSKDATLNNKQEKASQFFTSEQNKMYTGELTILGDPFYYFDSSLEAGRYEIFLQMNRANNRKTYEMGNSRYTGIYFLNGIRHIIDSSGKYTTVLSIIKRIFGASNDEEESSTDSSSEESTT